jgi:hypothetical protein
MDSSLKGEQIAKNLSDKLTATTMAMFVTCREAKLVYY